MDQLEPEILAYYSGDWDEDARLRSGLNEVEFVRTRELIRRYLPSSDQRILDVGGASGIHAAWLLEDGHSVHLVDPVALHVAQATEALGGYDGFTASIGDGRSLPVDDGSMDAVLLLGPLYHLTDRTDRLRVFRDAMRVARPGGFVFAAAITRFASLFAGLAKGELFTEDFAEVVRQDLEDGQHRNPAGRDYFTTAFFHHPDQLVEEATQAGLVDLVLYAVEGPVGASPQLAAAWTDPRKRDLILEFVRRVEAEPSLIGIGPHLLLVGRTPGN